MVVPDAPAATERTTVATASRPFSVSRSRGYSNSNATEPVYHIEREYRYCRLSTNRTNLVDLDAGWLWVTVDARRTPRPACRGHLDHLWPSTAGATDAPRARGAHRTA